ncbi:HAD family hydrolase [Microbacteriaceae bacterium 4G12]
MIQAVIFDFDGLIVDTETIWFEAFKEVVADYGIELSLEVFATCIGTTDEALYAYLKEQLREKWNEQEIQQKVHILHEEKMNVPCAREGVQEYLEEAKQLGLKIALASSSSREWVIRFLKTLQLEQYFEVIQTREDVEQVKPHPALYEQAVAALGIKPSEAVAFEDSVNGGKAAVAAGLKCVIVPNPVTEALVFETHHLRICSMKEKTLQEVIEYITVR